LKWQINMLKKDKKVTAFLREPESPMQVSTNPIFDSFCVIDEIMKSEKKANKPAIGAYKIEEADRRLYKPNVRRR